MSYVEKLHQPRCSIKGFSLEISDDSNLSCDDELMVAPYIESFPYEDGEKCPEVRHIDRFNFVTQYAGLSGDLFSDQVSFTVNSTL